MWLLALHFCMAMALGWVAYIHAHTYDIVMCCWFYLFFWWVGIDSGVENGERDTVEELKRKLYKVYTCLEF